ncbi:sensor histidine kinase [Paenibacillus sp. 1P07SE]|uniref:sensor histidine kinase n=1 Tax=Paenibacillus sp. 1P07SE TaxID=3132209 RepID=UPI0039A5DF64
MLVTLTIILAFLLAGQTIYMLVYRRQIRDIGQQLAFIVTHDSFKFVETQLHTQEIRLLSGKCNEMLEQQRQLRSLSAQRHEEINATIVNLSHDIRTPLTSLDGYLQLAGQAQDSQDQIRYVGLAKTRTRHMIDLVEELFLYTKLQNPAYRMDLQMIDAAGELMRSLLSFHGEFVQSGREPRLALPEQAVPVMANSRALERVFGNLIRNYLLHGTEELEVDFTDGPDVVSLRFANRLKPGAEPRMEHVFKRFYKGDAARTVNSTGLGLSIVHSLMEKMEGTTEAELQEGRFVIRVGFRKPEAGKRGTKEE